MGLSDYLRGSVEGDGGGVASYATDAPSLQDAPSWAPPWYSLSASSAPWQMFPLSSLKRMKYSRRLWGALLAATAVVAAYGQDDVDLKKDSFQHCLIPNISRSFKQWLLLYLIFHHPRTLVSITPSFIFTLNFCLSC